MSSFTSGGFSSSSGTIALSTISTLSVGILTGVSVVRSTDVQGQVADFTLTFTTPGILLQASRVELQLPSNQIAIKYGQSAYTVFDPTANLAYTLPGSTPAGYVTLYVNQWKCGANCDPTTFSIKISNSRNPYIQSTVYNDFIIKFVSTSDNLPIFQTSSPLLATPTLAIGIISPIAITHDNSPIIKRTTEYTFTFTTPSDVPAGGKFKFEWPPGRVAQYTSTAIVCKYGTVVNTCTSAWTTSSTLTPGAILTITVTGACPVLCAAGAYTFTFSGNMKNPD